MSLTVRFLLLSGLGLAASGCAFGGGAGLGLTVDTRGSVGVLLTAQLQTLGMRVEPQETQRHQAAIMLVPMQVAAGYELNPKAWMLQIDSPGIGFVADDVDNELSGFSGSMQMRVKIRWPEGSPTESAMGGALRFAWLPHLSVSEHPRLDSRPEWPDGFAFHSLGPAVDVSVLGDDKGVFGTFFAGAQYQYLSYFYLGL